MSLLSAIVLLLTVVVVLGVAGVTVLGVVVGRRAVRAGRRASRQLGRASTQARAALPGPTQAVHAERARVRRELASTLTAYETGRRAHRPVRMFESHAADLAAVGRQLDVDLTLVASEPDARYRAEHLDRLRPRVDTFVRACTHLRHGVLLAGDTYADAALQHTATELAGQVEYLTARAGAYRDLTAPTRPTPWPTPSPTD